MTTQIYPFTTSTDYFYGSNITVSGGVASLTDLGGGTYSTSNPTIYPKITILAESITSISTDQFSVDEDTIQYAIGINGTNYYWSGVVWTTSTGYSQSNLINDIQDNLSTLNSLLSGIKEITIVAYLHSEDGTTTPSLSAITISYDGPAIQYGDGIYDFSLESEYIYE
jgi:hypothetical protein